MKEKNEEEAYRVKQAECKLEEMFKEMEQYISENTKQDKSKQTSRKDYMAQIIAIVTWHFTVVTVNMRVQKVMDYQDNGQSAMTMKGNGHFYRIPWESIWKQKVHRLVATLMKVNWVMHDKTIQNQQKKTT